MESFDYSGLVQQQQFINDYFETLVVMACNGYNQQGRGAVLIDYRLMTSDKREQSYNPILTYVLSSHQSLPLTLRAKLALYNPELQLNIIFFDSHNPFNSQLYQLRLLYDIQQINNTITQKSVQSAFSNHQSLLKQAQSNLLEFEFDTLAVTQFIDRNLEFLAAFSHYGNKYFDYGAVLCNLDQSVWNLDKYFSQKINAQNFNFFQIEFSSNIIQCAKKYLPEVEAEVLLNFDLEHEAIVVFGHSNRFLPVGITASKVRVPKCYERLSLESKKMIAHYFR